MSVYLIPILIISVTIFACYKKVKVYDCFLDGTKDALSLGKTIFPYIATIYVVIVLFKSSGLSTHLTNVIAAPLSYLGIPKEITELMLLVPISGNGTIALLEDIIATYGVDSYVARCAAVVAGGSETIFYISAVYLSNCAVKRLNRAIPISLFCTLISVVIACALCRMM
jgi:spore maturation protein B